MLDLATARRVEMYRGIHLQPVLDLKLPAARRVTRVRKIINVNV